MNISLKKLLIAILSLTLVLTVTPSTSNAISPAAPSNIAVTYTAPPTGDSSPGATFTWVSPSAGDAQILGFRVSGKYNWQNTAVLGQQNWRNGQWSEIVGPRGSTNSTLDRYSIFSGSNFSLPTSSGYGLINGDRVTWRVGAVSDEPIAERKIGYNNICLLRISGVVECSGAFGSDSAGGSDAGSFNLENDFAFTYDYRPVDGVGPNGRVGLVKQLELGDKIGCVVARDGKVWCWGVQASDRGTQINRVNPTGAVSITPTNIALGASAIDIAIARNAVCALLTTGKIKCWGANDYGLLGNGSAVGLGNYARSATSIDDTANWIFSEITASETAMCAIATSKGGRAVNRQLVCWGGVGGLPFANLPNVATLNRPYAFNDNSVTGNRVAGTSPEGHFGILSISLARTHGCWVKEGVGLQCWTNINDPASFVSAIYGAPRTIDASIRSATEIASDSLGSCWIKQGVVNSLNCFGDISVGRVINGIDKSFTPVAVDLSYFQNANQISPTKISAYNGARCFTATDLGAQKNIGGCWGRNTTYLLLQKEGTSWLRSNSSLYLPTQDENLRRPEFSVIESEINAPPPPMTAITTLTPIAGGRIRAQLNFNGSRINLNSLTGIGYELSTDIGATWSPRYEIPSANFVLQNDPNIFTVDMSEGLVPGKYYKFRIYLKNRGGFGLPATISNQYPSMTLPTAVRNVTFTPHDRFTGVLQWDAPANLGVPPANPSSPVLMKYFVRIYDAVTGANKVVAETSQLSVNTQPNVSVVDKNNGLVPGQRYIAEIRATNSSAESAYREGPTTQFTFTMSARPETPKSITISQSNASTVNISWQPPDSSGANILRYLVYISRNGGAFDPGIPVTDALNYKFVTQPTIQYGVRISAVNSLGEGDISPTYFFRNDSTLSSGPATIPQVIIAPTSPRNLRAVGPLTFNSMSFAWDTPLNDGGERVTYKIQTSNDGGITKSEVASANLLHTPGSTTATIRQFRFQAGKKAYVYLIARNSAGESGAISIDISQTVAPSAPLNPMIGVVTYLDSDTPRSAYRLEWEAPISDGGAAIQGYNIRGTNCSAYCGTTVSTSNTYYEWPLDEFRPGLLLTLSIRATNGVLDSPETLVSMTTAVARPANINPTIDQAHGDSTTIALTFPAPSSPGAPIDGYQVYYIPVGALTVAQADNRIRELSLNGSNQLQGWIPVASTTENVEGGQVRLLISGLTLGSYYYFRVRASNPYGVSDFYNFGSTAFGLVLRSNAELIAEQQRQAQLQAEQLAREAEALRIAQEQAAERARLARIQEEQRLLAEALAAQLAEQERLAALERQRLLEEQARLAQEELLRLEAEKALQERLRLEAEQRALEEAARIAALEAERLRLLAEEQARERQRLIDEANRVAVDNNMANLGDANGPFQEIPVVAPVDQQPVVDPVVNPPIENQNQADNPPADNPLVPVNNPPVAPVDAGNAIPDNGNGGVIPAIPDDRVDPLQNPVVPPADNGGNVPVPAVFGNQNPVVPVANDAGVGVAPNVENNPPVVNVGGGGVVPLPPLPPALPPLLRDQVVAAVVNQEVLKIQEVAINANKDAALKSAEVLVAKVNEQGKVVNVALDNAAKVGFAVETKVSTNVVVKVPNVTPVPEPTTVVTEIKKTIVSELSKAEVKLINALPINNDVVIKTKTLVKKFTKLFPKGVKLAFSALSATLTKNSINQIKKLATIPFKKITITGYVQKSRSKRNDKTLSKSRADAVAKVLIKAGVKKKAVTTIAGGVGGKSKKNRSAVIIIA